MTEHKKYGNNRVQSQFKARQQLHFDEVARFNRERRKVAGVKGIAEVRKLLGEPVLGSLSDFI